MVLRGLPPVLVLLCGASLAQTDTAPRVPQEVIAWSAQNAQPLTDDLSPIKSLAGSARVLAFGEGTHNAHELWEWRNRLFAYAVEELGFTAMAAETGYAQSVATDDYVQGAAVSAAQATRGVFSWVDTAFQENRDLIEWMRAYNARPQTRRKLHFYGLEMSGSLRPDGRLLIEPALAYIQSVDARRAASMAGRVQPVLAGFASERYAQLTAAQQGALLAGVQDLVSAFERFQVVWIARSSAQDFQRAYRHAIAARQLLVDLRQGGDGRDMAAAENLRWVLEREGPQGRVFLFAHNSHVAKWRKLPDQEDQLHSTMNEFAHALLGDDLVVIASCYDQGTTRDWLGLFGFTHELRAVPASAPGSLNAMLGQVGRTPFLLDLRAVPPAGPVQEWFSRPQPVRNINVREGYNAIKPRAAFDALLFIRQITPLRVMPADAK